MAELPRLSNRPRAGLNRVRLVLLVSTLSTLLVAMMFRTTPIVLMAATMTAIVVASSPPFSTLLSFLTLRKLHARREMPSHGQVGDVMGGKITLHNAGRFPLLLVHIAPGFVAAPRRRHQAHAVPPVVLLSDEEHMVPLLRGGERTDFGVRWLLQKRGVFSMPPVLASARDPLNLLGGARAVTPSQEIVVVPRPVPIERIGLSGSANHSPQAATHANLAAEALDFHGVRAWRSGEPIRRVHWKSTARTGALHIVEWEDSPGCDICVLFDIASFPPAPDDENLEAAIVFIASIGAHCLKNGYGFQLLHAQQTYENSEYSWAHFQAESAGELPNLLDWLARLQPLHVETQRGKKAAPKNPLSSSIALATFGKTHLANGPAAIFIGGSQADFGGALNELSNSPSPTLHALMFLGEDEKETAPLAADVQRVHPRDGVAETLERLL